MICQVRFKNLLNMLKFLLIFIDLLMPVIQKIRKIIILFKYSQDYARQLKRQNIANKIKGSQKVNLDKGVRWNSTCKLNFL